MRYARRMSLAFVVGVTIAACKSGPSDKEIAASFKDDYKASAWKWDGLKSFACGKAVIWDIDNVTVTVTQRGEYNDMSRYWPFKVKLVGTCAGFIEHPPFTAEASIHLRKDDYGKWLASPD